MISVITEGSPFTGENLTLICNAVRVDNNMTEDVNLWWIGPDGEQVMTTKSVAVGVPTTLGTMTSLILQLTTLHTSNGGQYTCQGDVMSDGEIQSVSVISDVIVQGMYLSKILFN